MIARARTKTQTLSPYENVTSRLEKLRIGQPGQAMALCPAHTDKSRSLSVRETPEGAVLIHCFAGCTPHEVTAAIGIELSELYPPRERPARTPKRIAKLLTPSQALDLLQTEANLTAVCAGNLAQGYELSETDRARLMQAAGRILAIAKEAQNA